LKWSGCWIRLESGWTEWTNNAAALYRSSRPGAQRRIEAKQDRAKRKGVKTDNAARASRYQYEVMDGLASK
jgi:hypothetical protein